MNRDRFEQLRDLPGKRIAGPITFSKKQATQPMLHADNISIDNSLGAPLKMNINYNPETGAKGINVVHVGEGPICRLDVDGAEHRDRGRSHKHRVEGDTSVRRHLADGVVARPELAGKPLREVFAIFCQQANITFEGEFAAPDGGDGDE
jgi:hypothetical protein